MRCAIASDAAGILSLRLCVMLATGSDILPSFVPDGDCSGSSSHVSDATRSRFSTGNSCSNNAVV